MGRWPQGYNLLLGISSVGILESDVASVAGPAARAAETWTQVCGASITSGGALGQHWDVAIVFVADLADDPTVSPDPSQRQAWLDGLELGLTDEPVSATPHFTQLRLRLNPNPQGGWTTEKLYQVILHELGHGLGFDHAADGIDSCMSALLNQQITAPTPYDVAIARAIYGAPPVPPADPPIVAVTPPAVVSPPTQESHTVGPFGLVLSRSIPAFVAGQVYQRIRNQVHKGSTFDQALRHEIDNLDSNFTDPQLKGDVGDLLNGLLSVGEYFAGKGMDTFLGTTAPAN